MSPFVLLLLLADGRALTLDEQRAAWVPAASRIGLPPEWSFVYGGIAPTRLVSRKRGLLRVGTLETSPDRQVHTLWSPPFLAKNTVVLAVSEDLRQVAVQRGLTLWLLRRRGSGWRSNRLPVSAVSNMSVDASFNSAGNRLCLALRQRVGVNTLQSALRVVTTSELHPLVRFRGPWGMDVSNLNPVPGGWVMNTFNGYGFLLAHGSNYHFQDRVNDKVLPCLPNVFPPPVRRRDGEVYLNSREPLLAPVSDAEFNVALSSKNILWRSPEAFWLNNQRLAGPSKGNVFFARRIPKPKQFPERSSHAGGHPQERRGGRL